MSLILQSLPHQVDTIASVAGRVAGVVLAAGAGERIGHPKALLRTNRDDESFLQRGCRILQDAEVGLVVAVLAPGTNPGSWLGREGVRSVVNLYPERGQLSSLKAALQVLRGEPCGAVVVLPVDVPLVLAATVRSLIEAWRRLQVPVLRPTRGTEHGHPVVLSSTIFAELLAVDTPDGARPVVRAHASPEGDLSVEDDGAFVDIDTAEDYVRAFGRLPERAVVR